MFSVRQKYLRLKCQIIHQFCKGISEEYCVTGEEDMNTKYFLLDFGCYTPNKTETLALYLHSSHSFTKFFHSHLSLAVCLKNPNMNFDTYQIAEINVVSHALKIILLTVAPFSPRLFCILCLFQKNTGVKMHCTYSFCHVMILSSFVSCQHATK